MITKDTLLDLYIDKGMTDLEIAKFFNVDRTFIVHKRKEFGIVKESLHEQVIPIVEQCLKKRGHIVKYLKEHNKTYNIDFLVDGEIRVKVMTSSGSEDGRYLFTLTSQEKHKNIESINRIQLKNGRFRTLYRNICDFIIFVGVKNNDYFYWIVPSSDINDKLQTVATRTNLENKYYKYFESWDLIKKKL